jgi:predicted ATP-grasp superfamily ATP-dependent carboligase
MKPAYAIVIGLDCITGLQTARILARRGVPVLAIARDPSHYCCQTNVCERILEANTASQELIETLEALGPTLDQKAVLVPCTDMSVLSISRNRARLTPWYHFVLPEPETVEMLMDKVSFYTYAMEKELPIPGTFFLRTRSDADQAAEKLTFPCIMKPPLKTPTWEQNTRAKVFKLEDAEEFLQAYDRSSGWAELLMVQEWIEGTDANLYSCNCYYSKESAPLVTFIARKLRQWPPETGTSCLGEEVRNDFVLEGSLRLFNSVGYKGLGYVEMKRDERTGNHYIIEPNIGRPTGRSAIAEAGGVELVYTMYCDALGLPLPENRQQMYRGAKWIYLRQDLQSALHYWRKGELSLGEWLRSIRGRKVDAVLSWRDPGPFFADFFRGVGILFGSRKRAQ